MFLLDTDILSYTSPASRLSDDAAEAWRGWVRDNEGKLFLSVVTLMEIRFGVETLRAKGASKRSAALGKWLLITETIYRDRIVWVSPEIADKAGAMLARAVQAGVTPGSEDALIAASADISDFRLVTRNERHMNTFGIDCLNPLRPQIP